jgi:hypothetical protein
MATMACPVKSNRNTKPGRIAGRPQITAVLAENAVVETALQALVQ